MNTYKYLGKRVRRKNKKNWEEGVVVLHNFKNEPQEEFIKYDKRGNLEQLYGLDFQIFNEQTENWENF